MYDFSQPIDCKHNTKPLEVINAHNTQHLLSMSEIFADHKIGRELGKISAWLDSHSEIWDWASADILRENLKATGRSGMTIASI